MALEVRGTHGDVLHRMVERGSVGLRAALEAADAGLPGFVWRELERYVRCGDPEAGFAWLVCDACEVHRLVPLSCKGRAFCPACTGRRMSERAWAWCERVLPEVPYRQWVLTLPWSRRRLLAYRPELARGVLDVALAEVQALLVDRARQEHGVEGRTGAVTAQQRFDGGLRLNLHFHSLIPEGVWARGDDGRLVFHRVRPTRADLEGLVERIADRAERWLAARGVDDEPTDPDEAQAVLVAASAAGTVAAGPRAGQQARRLIGPAPEDRDEDGPGGGVSAEGYGLHAGTWVAAADREGLERLARYLLRPPLAKARLEERPDGNVVLHLRRPWRDGTRAFVFSPAELVERLAALVVRPRVHTTHFHGVFAAHAAWRPEVVPDPAALKRRREDDEARRAAHVLARRTRRARRRFASAWCPWSDLLEHVFGTVGFTCPGCTRPLRLRAVVLGRPATSRVLAGLRRAARAPPAPPAPTP